MISVCIATYNGGKYIQEQILSILPQLSADDEVIVSDDGSSDNTLRNIKELKSPQIKVFQNSRSRGYTSNFENALTHANGDIIFICDQDDIWLPNKVMVVTKQLQNNDFVISDAVVVNENAQDIIVNSFYAMRRSKPGFLHNLYRFSYLGCCLAFKRKILDKALPFPSNHKLCTHDNWLTIIGMAYFKTTIINDKLVKYRRHEGNTSPGGFVNETNLLFKIQYRIYLIYHLVCRGFSRK